MSKVLSLEERIAEKVAGLEVPALAKKASLPLLKKWLDYHAKFDERFPTLAVEAPSYLWLDKQTLLVSTLDRVACVEKKGKKVEGVFGCEWKSTKEAGKYWNEERWLASISISPQAKTYALMLHEGVVDGVSYNVTPPVSIVVRAVTKSSSPEVWPTDQKKGILSFGESMLHATKSAYLSLAERIRAARKFKHIPWQLPGLQCENRFTRELCPFIEDCQNAIYVPDGLQMPGNESKAIELALKGREISLDNPNLVVLSYSQYTLATECLEKWRRGFSETNINLQIGSALHAGLAEIYNVQKENIKE